jgi:hypothetical protein
MTCLGSVDSFLGPDAGPPRQQVLLRPLLVGRPLKRGGGGRRPQSGQCKQQQQFHWADRVRIPPACRYGAGEGVLAAAPRRDGTGGGGGEMSCGVCQQAGLLEGVLRIRPQPTRALPPFLFVQYYVTHSSPGVNFQEIVLSAEDTQSTCGKEKNKINYMYIY